MITTATKQTYQKDRALEDKFSKTIKGILGNVFITKDIQMDLLHGTDFLTLTVNPFKVAVRLRRQDGNFERYKKEFTIRWSRPSGIETEIHKIKKGLVDYIFYWFVGKEETRIIQYFVGDLRIFNQYEKQPTGIFLNKPPDSKLAVWRIDMFPNNFIKHFYSHEET